MGPASYKVEIKARVSYVATLAVNLFLVPLLVGSWAPTASAFTRAESCSSLFASDPHSFDSTVHIPEALKPEALKQELTKHGISVGPDKRAEFTFTSQLPPKPRSWEAAKTAYLTNGKVERPSTLEQATADLVSSLINDARYQGFESTLSVDKQILFSVRAPGDSFEWTFDLSAMAQDLRLAGWELARFEELHLSRKIHERVRSSLVPGSETALTLSAKGVQISAPLKGNLLRTDADLQGAYVEQIRQAKEASSTEAQQAANLEASLTAAEVLARRGYVVEISPSRRATYLVRLLSLRTGFSNELMTLVQSVRDETGGEFAIDPIYYLDLSDVGGVSDAFAYDYSINSNRLWSRPDDFVKPSPTLLHEIHHVRNANRWLKIPNDLTTQCLDGEITSTGYEQLGTNAYRHYFQFDEITAAMEDMRNAQSGSDRAFYQARAKDLVLALQSRLKSVEKQVRGGRVTTHISSNGLYLGVEAKVKSSVHAGSDVTFIYYFPDLTEATSAKVITQRFLERLAELRYRLRTELLPLIEAEQGCAPVCASLHLPATPS